MAHSKSALKRVRQGEVRHKRNKSKRSALRTQLRKTSAAIQSGQREAAEKEMKKSISVLDKAAVKGLIHKNQAARRKSRLAKKMRAVK